MSADHYDYYRLTNLLNEDYELLNEFEEKLSNTDTGEIRKIRRIKKDIERTEAEIQLKKAKLAELSQHQANISLKPKVPFVLPQSDIKNFTGRKEELDKLEELLLNNQGTKFCSIAGLAGVGGIGKSVLAYHFATKHRAKFPDGIIGIRVDGKDVNTIAREFARRCGEKLDSEDERDAATIMQETFAYRRMLLIFDNAEDADIESLHPRGNRCAIIVTTRDKGLAISLKIPLESRINLTPFPDPDSLELLEKLIGKERMNAERDAVYKLLEFTGNLPLAIQIVGSQLQLNENRSLADYVNSLSEERRLVRMKIGDDENLNLEACFSLSLKYLKPDQVDFFACLSVCAEEGFSRKTASVVTDFENEYDAQDYLDYLCRLCLVNYAETGENRFIFHTLVRLFAKELALERQLHEIASERHGQYFLKLVKSNHLNDNNGLLGEEIDDIILTAQWLQQKEVFDYEFADNLNDFFEDYGYYKRAIAITNHFIVSAENNSNWAKVVVFKTRLAKYWQLQSKLSEAKQLLRTTAEIIKKIESPKERKYSNIKLGLRLASILGKQNRLNQAEEILISCLNIAKKLGDLQQIRNVLDSLGNIFRKTGRINKALAIFQRLIKISEALNDQQSVAIALNYIGGVLQQQGKLDQALTSFQQQLKISEGLNDQKSVAIALNCIGGIFQQQGKLKEALISFQQQLKISEALNDQQSVAIALNRIAGIFQQQRKLNDALTSFQQVIEISEALNDQKQKAIALHCIGNIFQQQGKLDQALTSFQQVIKISEGLNDQKQKAIALNCIGGIFQQQGKFDEAVTALTKSKTICEDEKNDQTLAYTLHILGKVLDKKEKYSEAEHILRQVYDLQDKLDDTKGKAITCNSLGQVLSKQQGEEKFELALMYFKQSIKLGEQLHNRPHLAQVHTAMGQCLLKHRKLEEAARELSQGFRIDEQLKNRSGIVKVTPQLTYVLAQLNRREEALIYCQLALNFAPENQILLDIQTKLQSSQPLNNLNNIIQGKVKFKRYNRQHHNHWGYIQPNDGSEEIYYREGFIDSEIIKNLTEGTLVEVEIRENKKGLYAHNIWIIY